ncbi:MAG: undecaprenyl-diphosphate phosphatase [Bacteroidetes bacterium]|nr:undecaprenyl-diphosphate phosphatase [Bacteroidota bacterium]
MTFFQAIIIAIVEGLTEFLPISSTYHMALTSKILGIDLENDLFIKLFIESIQFGAIVSVIFIYWRKFFDFTKFSFYYKIIVAFVPAAIVGVLLKKHIDNLLGNLMVMTVITFLGGFLLIFADKWFNKSKEDNLDNVSYKKSFLIGIFQLLAIVFPGFSRSAATIIGGMQQKLSRKLAAEFSFFLAVPTLAGAFVKSMWDAYKHTPELLNKGNINLLIVGNVIAFIVAMIAIKGFIAFLTKYGFKAFGYYRIIMGAAVILLLIFHIL